MSTTKSSELLDFLKQSAESEMVVREESESNEPVTDAVNFSDVAQDGSIDTKAGVTNRIFAQKGKSDAAERALMGAVLNTRDFETSNIQIKPVEKVSFQRSESLRDRVIKKFGRQ